LNIYIIVIVTTVHTIINQNDYPFPIFNPMQIPFCNHPSPLYARVFHWSGTSSQILHGYRWFIYILTFYYITGELHTVSIGEKAVVTLRLYITKTRSDLNALQVQLYKNELDYYLVLINLLSINISSLNLRKGI